MVVTLDLLVGIGWFTHPFEALDHTIQIISRPIDCLDTTSASICRTQLIFDYGKVSHLGFELWSNYVQLSNRFYFGTRYLLLPGYGAFKQAQQEVLIAPVKVHR